MDGFFAKVVIRRPTANEQSDVRALVQTVVDEACGGIWTAPPVPIDEDDWSLAWIAMSDGKIVGTILTNEKWISELWVFRESRRSGVGSALLAHDETEIVNRGYRTLRLRVVKATANALQFYQRRAWKIEREFVHEGLPIAMIEMSKVRRSAG